MASSSSSLDPKTHNPTANPPTPQALPHPNLQSTPKTLTHSPQIHKIQEPSQVPSQGMSYPLASSGRGFVPKAYRAQSSEQLGTVTNPGGFPRNAPQFSNQARPFGVSPSNAQTPLSMRPPSQFGPRFMNSSTGTGSAPLKSSPVVANHNKTSPFQSPASGNGYRDSRETNRDDTVVTVHHRKVRLSDGASLYALCRSWVRNGLPKETQPPLGEGLKLLPRPLPISVANNQIPEKSGSEDEDEETEEEVSSVENMSILELLRVHVKHAKKTRARLRRERLQRIDRYKQRLALLLPPPEEQVRERDVGESF